MRRSRRPRRRLRDRGRSGWQMEPGEIEPIETRSPVQRATDEERQPKSPGRERLAFVMLSHGRSSLNGFAAKKARADRQKIPRNYIKAAKHRLRERAPALTCCYHITYGLVFRPSSSGCRCGRNGREQRFFRAALKASGRILSFPAGSHKSRPTVVAALPATSPPHVRRPSKGLRQCRKVIA